MRITDIIRDFISNIRTKKLPPPKQVDTKVIPIICGKKDSERILSVIILAQFENGILAKYNNQGYGLIFEEMRKEYKNELKYSHSNENFEEIFYQSIIKKMRFLTTTSIYAK